MITFEPWPKTPRLNKAGSMTISEKLDGTNACVVVQPVSYEEADVSDEHVVGYQDSYFEVGAQSRNRLLTLAGDNAGFARWVHTHANQLVQLLGPGRHFGEWWGFDSVAIKDTIDNLAFNGSEATLRCGLRFNKPEGVVIYHHELRGSLKAFVVLDDVPKGEQA